MLVFMSCKLVFLLFWFYDCFSMCWIASVFSSILYSSLFTSIFEYLYFFSIMLNQQYSCTLFFEILSPFYSLALELFLVWNTIIYVFFSFASHVHFLPFVMLMSKCYTYILSHSHNDLCIILHIIICFYSISLSIFKFQIIISTYFDNIQCVCCFLIYNATCIFGLKDSSMMGYNMVHKFRDSLFHTINFGASLIMVLFFLLYGIFSFIFCLYTFEFYVL